MFSKKLGLEKYSVVPRSGCGKAVLMKIKPINELLKKIFNLAFPPLRVNLLYVCMHIFNL